MQDTKPGDHDYRTVPIENPDAKILARAEIGPFYRALRALASLVGECVLELTEGTIYAIAKDPASVAIVEVNESGLEHIDEPMRIAVDLKDVPDGLPPYYDDREAYQLSIYTDEDDDSYLRVENAEGTLEIPAHEPDHARDVPEWPDVSEDFDTECTLPAFKVRGAFGALAETSGVRWLRVEPDYGSLNLQTIDSDDELHDTWCLDADVVAGEPALYSTDFLSDVMEGLNADGEITISFGDYTPIKFETDGLTYMVAPRIPVEDL